MFNGPLLDVIVPTRHVDGGAGHAATAEWATELVGLGRDFERGESEGEVLMAVTPRQR